MIRAERLRRILLPIRQWAGRIRPEDVQWLLGPHLPPRVELESAIMTASDEPVVMAGTYRTLALPDELRRLGLEHWDRVTPQNAPHYWSDYEVYSFDSPPDVERKPEPSWMYSEPPLSLCARIARWFT